MGASLGGLPVAVAEVVNTGLLRFLSAADAGTLLFGLARTTGTSGVLARLGRTAGTTGYLLLALTSLTVIAEQWGTNQRVVVRIWAVPESLRA